MRPIHYLKILKISLLSFVFVSCASHEASRKEDFIYSTLASDPELMEIVLKKKHNTLNEKEVPVWRAIGFLGTPYKFGSSSNDELDCSAFVQKIFQNIKNLERTSYGQFLQLRKNAKMKPDVGDLVFFKTANYNPVTHVGIMYSKTKFIHASTTQKVVSTGDLTNRYWKRKVYAYVDPFNSISIRPSSILKEINFNFDVD